jgi:hypothetical protein
MAWWEIPGESFQAVLPPQVHYISHYVPDPLIRRSYPVAKSTGAPLSSFTAGASFGGRINTPTTTHREAPMNKTIRISSDVTQKQLTELTKRVKASEGQHRTRAHYQY